jgi:hypothetical protein
VLVVIFLGVVMIASVLPWMPELADMSAVMAELATLFALMAVIAAVFAVMPTMFRMSSVRAAMREREREGGDRRGFRRDATPPMECSHHEQSQSIPQSISCPHKTSLTDPDRSGWHELHHP